MKKKLCCLLSVLLFVLQTFPQSITTCRQEQSAFGIGPNHPVSIYVDDIDYPLVKKVALLLQKDIKAVTGFEPTIVHQLKTRIKNVIVIGTIEKSTVLQRLIQQKKIAADHVPRKWEAYLTQLVKDPFPGVDHALIFAGGNRRGTAYGVLEFSKEIGVSPWYWWADVPIKKQATVYIKKRVQKADAPLVKYRGIFINDEAPALSGWSKEKFGGFNHLFYEKVFELILRLKGNYLWPAMWGNAFNDDDPLNPKLADEYGIVMGTSHHEPLVRAHDEWRRYGSGKWNYDSNAIRLQDFWRKGIERMGSYENVVSIGMRGDGDEPMTQGTAIALLERIVKDQRAIIASVTKKDASTTPQMWALYKEVQDYYDKGMRVPDDVTLLLCDDNWGNIRKLPSLKEKPRSGGYGIYYHFDYVGDPRNYKWLNTNTISRTWEQMHLAYEYGVKQLWIVNVGDIKPMELPTSFFLDYAWNPRKWTANNLLQYTQEWSAQQFGRKHAAAIAAILNKYTQYNSRRKPELLSPDTYSIANYNEAATVVREYNDLLVKAEQINTAIPAADKDAFFQLVLHPVKACANLNNLYVAAAKNRQYAEAGDIRANLYADSVKYFFQTDSLISLQYNKGIAGGKWNHMMDQTHIGYTYWQQPFRNKMPDVTYVKAEKSTVAMNDTVTMSMASAGRILPQLPRNGRMAFCETDGYVSINAAHFSKKAISGNNSWQVIRYIGRSGDGITRFPVTAPAQSADLNSSYLVYEIYTSDSGHAQLHCYFSPTLNVNNDGLRYAVSIDNEAPQVINLHEGGISNITWARWVANNIIIKSTDHHLAKPGKHLIRFWSIDPGIVLQKLVLDLGGLKPSYLGPQETLIKPIK